MRQEKRRRNGVVIQADSATMVRASSAAKPVLPHAEHRDGDYLHQSNAQHQSYQQRLLLLTLVSEYHFIFLFANAKLGLTNFQHHIHSSPSPVHPDHNPIVANTRKVQYPIDSLLHQRDNLQNGLVLLKRLQLHKGL